MTSKYDRYWAGHLDEIRDALARAAEGFPATVPTPGLRGSGGRQSWYGLAEVRAGEMTHSSMAHATSLGRTVAASGICAQWPQDTFRLAISAAGDALTITAASHQASLAGTTGRHRQARRAPATPAPAPAARAVPAPAGPARVMAGQAGPGEFYRMLAELAGLLGGARPLRDCRAGDCPGGGVYFSFEDGEVRGDGSSGYVKQNSITLTSQLAASQDQPSPGWLGHHANPGQIRQSGLWNVQHVTQLRHPGFLPTLQQLIQLHR